MPAPSLHSLCRKACIKNVHSLTDVGDFEYHQISDILSYLKSPEQLHTIEKNSPQIKGADADLWQKFIAKEVPKWATKNYAPKNPLKWYEVYKRYKKEQAQEIKRDEEILRKTMMGIKKARDGNLSKVVDLGSLPKLPRDPRMVANNGGVLIGRAGQKKEPASFMTFTKGSKTKMSDGKSVLTRARREAKEIAQMGKLSRPTHQLTIGRVVKAPEAMVKEYRTANQPALKILSRRTGMKVPEAGNIALEEREKRLRALTSGSKANGKKPHLIDSEDESEVDDLFDDHPTSVPKSRCLLKNQNQRPILSAQKTNDAKRPSDVISAMISKSNSSSRNVAISGNTRADQSLLESAALASRCRPPSDDDASIERSKPIGSSVARTLPASPATMALGKVKPIMAVKRRQVDIFNRSASKRPRSG